jgi:hypothetical protein
LTMLSGRTREILGGKRSSHIKNILAIQAKVCAKYAHRKWLFEVLPVSLIFCFILLFLCLCNYVFPGRCFAFDT